MRRPRARLLWSRGLAAAAADLREAGHSASAINPRCGLRLAISRAIAVVAGRMPGEREERRRWHANLRGAASCCAVSGRGEAPRRQMRFLHDLRTDARAGLLAPMRPSTKP